MPTPRLSVQIARIRAQQAGSVASGQWVPGVVLSSLGDASSVYQVLIRASTPDTPSGSVEAFSVIDAPLFPNTVVWLARDSAGRWLIVSSQSELPPTGT